MTFVPGFLGGGRKPRGGSSVAVPNGLPPVTTPSGEVDLQATKGGRSNAKSSDAGLVPPPIAANDAPQGDGTKLAVAKETSGALIDETADEAIEDEYVGGESIPRPAASSPAIGVIGAQPVAGPPPEVAGS